MPFVKHIMGLSREHIIPYLEKLLCHWLSKFKVRILKLYQRGIIKRNYNSLTKGLQTYIYFTLMTKSFKWGQNIPLIKNSMMLWSLVKRTKPMSDRKQPSFTTIIQKLWIFSHCYILAITNFLHQSLLFVEIYACNCV